MREVKGNKKGFYRYVSRKRKMRENTFLMLNVTAALRTQNTERTKFSKFYSPQLFLVTLAFRNETQDSETSGKVWIKENLHSVE